MYKIDIVPRIFHFNQPAGTSRGVYLMRQSWLLKVYRDDNPEKFGVGECAPLPDLSCDYSASYESVLRSFCNVFEADGKIDYAGMRDYPSMLFGLETALAHLDNGCLAFWDTPFSRGEEGIPINGLVWMGTYDEMLERIEHKLESGFRCVKLKIGAIDFDAEIDLIKHIRDRFSSRELELRVDANGAFAFEEALYKLELLSQYAIHSIEQPIKARQWGNMAQLCRESPLPIALDEELIGVNDKTVKKQLLNVIKPAYIILKPSLHGGMQGCLEWIAEANERRIGSWITSALESNIGLNAIAQFAAATYGPGITFAQGLGTGMLFADNEPSRLEIRNDALWFNPL